LTTQLTSCIPEILSRWETAVRATLPAARPAGRPLLAEVAPVLLSEVAGGSASAGKSRSAAAAIRAENGSLPQVLHEYHLLRKAIFEVLEAEQPLPTTERWEIQGAIDQAVEAASAAAARAHWDESAETEQQYRLLVESAIDFAIFTLDAEGRVLTWNSGAQRITGYRAEEIIGAAGALLFTPEDRERGEPEKELRTAAANGRAEDERWHLRKGGSRFFASGVMAPLRGSEPRRFAKLMRDITERKELERALRQRAEELTAADRHKDEFLAMLAHELRNPLAPMRNAVALLSRRGSQDPSLRRPLEIIEHQVDLQARLLDDLLNVSRIGRGTISLHSERLDLTALIRKAAADHQHVLEAAGLMLSVELPDRPVWIDGDPTRLSQVMNNLIQNASKFTGRGGRVGVRCQVSEGGVVVTVWDTGIGISPELLPRVFDSFMQADRSLDRSRGGLGLGLAMVKGLVALHGGQVSAHSEGIGKGTEMSFRLPLDEEEDEIVEAVVPLQKPAGRSLRILVVEDNPDGAESLEELLTLMGHQVAVAYSGAEGVEAARRHPPQVVLCDIGLPGMDGYAVARELRRDPTTAGAMLIAQSGYGRQEDQRRSREAGFDWHLTKPLDLDELERLLSGFAAKG
jgi:PAS domain S-box-containing protein